METRELKGSLRTGKGKGVARKLRAQGLIPAVCYGNNVEPVSFTLSPEDLKEAVSGVFGRNVLISLEIEGKKSVVMLKDFDIHPVTYDLRHADFFVVDDKKTVEADVPIRLVGRAAGQAAGGVLRQVQRTVRVSCVPSLIPSEITYDVSDLEIKQRALASQITPPEGVSLVIKADFAFAQVNAPRGAEDVVESDEEEVEEEE